MKERIEKALAELQSSLGESRISLLSINKGIVTMQYRKPLSSSATCHPDRAQITRDIVFEVIEDKLRQDISELKEIIIVDA